MINKNDIIELSITDMTFEGMGVAKYSDDDLSNFVIFIHNAVIGDIADCRIVKVLKNHAYAIIEKIIKPSDDRIHSACSFFSKCGGCTYQNINYETELKYKKNCISHSYKHNYPDYQCDIEDVVPSPSIIGYRNKIQYPLSLEGKFGFYAKRSHRIVPVDHCNLQDDDFGAIIEAVEKYIKRFGIVPYDETTGKGLLRHLYLRKAPSTDEIMVCLVATGSNLPHKEQLTSALSSCKNVKSIFLNINKADTNVILGRECIPIWGKDEITDELCGLKFNISPLSFYQINSEQTENLYNYIINSGMLSKEDILLDICSGIGTISLIAAKKVKHVFGVEIVGQAVNNAYENAALNKIENVNFFRCDMKEISTLDSQFKKIGDPTVIIVDPPRKGLSEETIEAIKHYLPEKFIYISCNPATQARDISKLNKDKKLYEINKIKPFDMFPRTGHVESVALMSRK